MVSHGHKNGAEITNATLLVALSFPAKAELVMAARSATTMERLGFSTLFFPFAGGCCSSLDGSPSASDPSKSLKLEPSLLSSSRYDHIWVNEEPEVTKVCNRPLMIISTSRFITCVAFDRPLVTGGQAALAFSFLSSTA